ncbi:MAG: hypothetical protein WC931_04205 [Bacilli bacterium]|jgi:hypothetical protein
MSANRGSIKNWRDFLELVRNDPEYFHELVTNTGEALLELENLPEFIKNHVKEISPGDLLAFTIGTGIDPIDWCDVTCGGKTCEGTCGDDSCGTTCWDSCSGTCGSNSCGTTTGNPGDVVTTNPPDSISQSPRLKFNALRRR